MKYFNAHQNIKGTNTRLTAANERRQHCLLIPNRGRHCDRIQNIAFSQFLQICSRRKKKNWSFFPTLEMRRRQRSHHSHTATHTLMPPAPPPSFFRGRGSRIRGSRCHGRPIHHQRHAVEGASMSVRGRISIRPPSLKPGKEKGGGTNSDCVG